jgi:hypothetical protein
MVYVQKTEVVSAYFYLGISLDRLGGWKKHRGCLKVEGNQELIGIDVSSQDTKRKVVDFTKHLTMPYENSICYTMQKLAG